MPTGIWKLIGFDARFPAEAYTKAMWDSDSRATYLLDEKLQWPLSVDPLVWPSVFKGSAGDPWEERLRLSKIDARSELNYEPLWFDLDQMRAKLNGARREKSALQIAIEIYVSDQAELAAAEISPPGVFSEIKPPSAPDDTTVWGYDLADAGLTSGLTDCGYETEEKPAIAQRWMKKLNQHGLFSSFESALAFKPVCDARVPEHAPFYVYKLCRLVA